MAEAAVRLAGRGSHLRLVPTSIKPRKDVIEALEVLLDEARAGEITGIAFACTLRGGADAFITNVAGDCYERPTQARGIVVYLADQIASLQHRVKDRDR